MARFFNDLRNYLDKTREILVARVDKLIFGTLKFDEQFFDELETILLTADVGIKTTTKILDKIRLHINKGDIIEIEMVKPFLKKIILDLLDTKKNLIDIKPHIILVVGINGVGKTTSIGKLANFYKLKNKKVLVGAADTFREAAIDQLKEWTEKAKVEIITRKEGSDPAAVVFDTLKAAKECNIDVVIIDTAGRLQTKVNLMEELKKINRVIKKEIETAPHEILLVIDGNAGQNAISQGKHFSQAVGVTGIILTKIDGSAKGGAALAIKSELGLPICWVGVGEKIDDLRKFNAKEYIDGLFNK